ncbi:MAG TPA: LuxR C-terminal-related transcriptional regulator [Chloroflexota bacterium]|nr:LuxR C-terminal-related transcriptional regulator [Chloroflexota bacterium]
MGRERELEELRRLLGAVRVLTLTGPGGVGKTRLAMEAAVRAEREQPDSVCLVELAALSDPLLLPQTVARSLGLQEDPSRTPTEHLLDALRDRRLLLILDNCEHLLAACSQLVEGLIGACPGVIVLTTSREPLRASGETVWQTPPLSLEASPANPASEAVALFAERARARLPGFELNPQNRGAVAELCRRLDGLPLPIELAAARANVLTPEQLASELDEHLAVLGRMDAPARHQTLEAMLGWSHSLLSETEKRVFRRLAVFSGGGCIEGVEAVCGEGLTRAELLDVLSGLVDKSLLCVRPRAGEMHYLFLETVRSYAWQKLREAGEDSEYRDRHLAWYCELAARWRHAFLRPDASLLTERQEARLDNFRAALDWARTEPRHHLVGLQLAADVEWFWHGVCRVGEGQQRLLDWLSIPLTMASRDAQRARVWAEIACGQICIYRVDLVQSRAHLETGLRLAQELGDVAATARALTFLGIVQTYTGDLAGARSSLEQAVRTGRELGDPVTSYFAIHGLAQVHQFLGDAAKAAELDSEGLHLAESHGSPGLIGISSQRLGQAKLRCGDVPAAEAAFRESLRRTYDWAGKVNAPYAFDGLACAAAARNQAERAWRLRGAAAALREAIGAGLNPTESAGIDRWCEPARIAIGAETAQRAWQEGFNLPLDEAIAYALTPEQGCSDAAPMLTERQQEILRLLAGGWSNQQIASALVLSVRTVERHVDDIYRKLGVHTRVEAARRAISLGLAPPALPS